MMSRITLGRLTAIMVTALALITASPAAAEWREASSDHFLIYADSDERWLQGFADRLERVDGAMRLMRSMDTPPGARSNRLTIYVVSNTDAVKNLCGKNCGGVAGFYVPRAGGSIAFTPRRTFNNSDPNSMSADIVLFHEYAHQLMLENFAAAYPRWFIEGFAEFNSTAKIEPDGAVTMGRPAQHRAYGLIVTQPIPIATLLDDSKVKFDDQQQDAFYGRAWLLTHMLAFATDRDGQLATYLKLINQGKSSLDAAKAAFGDLKKLDRDLQTYLNNRHMNVFRLPADRIKVGSITLRLLSAGEAATMAVRMQSDRGVTLAEAKKLLPEARRRTADFPNDAAAQLVLAEAEFDAGNAVLSEAAADRALTVEPKNADALMYKGRARLRMAVDAKATDPAVWKEARSWFVKANRLDPDAATPLMLFYTSFLAANEKPSASAVNGLQRAFELSAQDDGLRVLTVRQFLTDEKLPEARGILLPLAYDPHGGPDNPAVKWLAMIDAGNTGKQVLAVMDQSSDGGEGGQGKEGDGDGKK